MEQASSVFEDPRALNHDVSRHEEGEVRTQIIGMSHPSAGDSLLLSVVYTRRGPTSQVIRIISVRRCSQEERKGYEQT